MLLQVPPGAVAMEWGYEGDHPFAATCARLARAGIPFYACPGTSTWNSFVGRTRNALDNIRAACRAARDHHGLGMLVRGGHVGGTAFALTFFCCFYFGGFFFS